MNARRIKWRMWRDRFLRWARAYERHELDMARRERFLP